MEKMSGESMNLLNENIEKLKALFPEIVTDGKIDFDMLKTLLGEEVDASNEKYSFNWVGKRNCIKFAQTPSTGTLIPCKEKSVDFDNTQNIYIEGDNVEALKLLQKTYFGKIKMIYIDPPYNTGNDFVYHDDYKDSIENYKKITGQQATANPETNGRFHTDWLNMMYPRLKLAKDLISDDGVIFISIGQAENHNLIKCCDDIFNEINRVGVISRMMKSGGNKGMYFSPNMEYVLVYAKNINSLGYFREPISDELIAKVYNQVETSGERVGQKYRIMGLYQAGLDARPNQRYWIQCPDGSYAIPQGKTFPIEKYIGSRVLPQDGDGVWRWSADRFLQELKNNNILFKQTNTSSLVDENGNQSKWNIYTKIWLADRLDEGRVPVDLITKWENRISSQELKDLDIPFDFAKPTELIKYFISLVDKNEESYVLDFFSGSATTAHAVMQLNAEDGGNRKFIMVQLPELCDEKSEAYKAGYKTICDIGEERIRRAGAKIKEENPLTTLNLDTGFKVFRLDSTNIVPWNNAEKLDEMCLYDYAKTIKDDRDDLSVAYEIMLKYGVFDKPMKETVVSGKKMYDVGEGYMIICLADGVTMTDVEAIARLNPHCVVFKESGFADDNEKINATHTLERGGVEKILCI